jgi:hypothetical protein
MALDSFLGVFDTDFVTVSLSSKQSNQ